MSSLLLGNVDFFLTGRIDKVTHSRGKL
jgi:hypothetical protein